MSPVEVAGLGVLFIACLTVSAVVTLNLLLPSAEPTVGYPLCEREPRP